MEWPDRPTCHDSVPVHASRRVRWKNPTHGHTSVCDCGYVQVGPYAEPFRTCSFCNSIDEQDLAHYLRTDKRIKLIGLDWKRGFPHYLSVEGIPNPLAGTLVDTTSSRRCFDHEPTQEEIERQTVEVDMLQDKVVHVLPPGWIPGHPDNRLWNVHVHGHGPAPATTLARFYTEHLEDEGYDTESHDLIEWSIIYHVPYYGYQHV